MATPENTSLVNQTLLLRNAGCISLPAQPSYFCNAGCISSPTRSRRVWFTHWWWNTSSAAEVEGSGSWDYPQCKQFSRVAPSRCVRMEAPANVDTTRLLNRYGMIEKSYHASRFVRGSVAWPASMLCCAKTLRTLCSGVHLDLHGHHVFAHCPTAIGNIRKCIFYALKVMTRTL